MRKAVLLTLTLLGLLAMVRHAIGEGVGIHAERVLTHDTEGAPAHGATIAQAGSPELRERLGLRPEPEKEHLSLTEVVQAPPEVLKRFGYEPGGEPTLTEAYEAGQKLRAEQAQRLGKTCDRVKASYGKDKVPLHRMDNYWRCLQVQNLSLSPEGYVLKWGSR